MQLHAVILQIDVPILKLYIIINQRPRADCPRLVLFSICMDPGVTAFTLKDLILMYLTLALILKVARILPTKMIPILIQIFKMFRSLNLILVLKVEFLMLQ